MRAVSSSASPAATSTSPTRALDAWLRLRSAGPGALFIRIFHHGHVTTDRFGPPGDQQDRAERADAAGFDGIPVTGHSLRAAHVTTAAGNAPVDPIDAHTRHRDLGTLLNHYIYPAEGLATSTSRDLGL